MSLPNRDNPDELPPEAEIDEACKDLADRFRGGEWDEIEEKVDLPETIKLGDDE